MRYYYEEAGKCDPKSGEKPGNRNRLKKKNQKSKTPMKKTDDWIHSQGFLSSYYKYVEIKG